MSSRKIILSKEDFDKAVKRYESGLALKKVAKELGISEPTLKKNFINNGIDITKMKCFYKRKDVNLKSDAFETIDTEEKAYWLGFLLADGYITKDYQYIEIALKQDDLKHIEKFKSFLCSKAKISYKEKAKAYKITITSKKLCADLKKHGVYNNKSLTCKLNEEIMNNESLKWHYLRGLFDGDGSIQYVGETGFSCSITSNEELCLQVKELDLFKKYTMHKKKDSNAFQVRCFGENAKLFLKNIYSESKVYLERKYNMYNCRLGEKVRNIH